ncbi:hypothetical protein HNY73_017993 [Argiope bruennichi]|uniref:DUF19 domain-containing protein n=1 Tax=Argiope bruennichi TaxID=94029 RepID=A0A8T0ECK4_ARGBR|nr:hypothetical protein HNY73_017993 [Argiope bruennichi]
MNFFALFAFGALIGSVYCDNECFRSVFDCKGSSENSTMCSAGRKQFGCILNKAIECKMGFTEDAKKVMKLMENTCTEGKAMTRLFNQNQKCFNLSINDKKCKSIIENIILDNSMNFIQTNKLLCRKLDTYTECIIESVVDNCGRGVKSFFSHIFDRLVTLSRSICDEIILPADDTDEDDDNVGNFSPFSILVNFFGRIRE